MIIAVFCGAIISLYKNKNYISQFFKKKIETKQKNYSSKLQTFSNYYNEISGKYKTLYISNIRNDFLQFTNKARTDILAESLQSQTETITSLTEKYKNKNFALIVKNGIIQISNELKLWNKHIHEFGKITDLSMDLSSVAADNSIIEKNGCLIIASKTNLKNTDYLFYFILSADEINEYLSKSRKDMIELFEAEQKKDEMEISSDRLSLHNFITTIIKDNIYIIIIIVIAGIFMLAFLIRMMFAKLGRLTEGVRQIQTNNYSYRVNTSSINRDEIDEFAEQFNKMADHIENERLQEIIAVIENLVPAGLYREINNTEISAYYKPAREIGGDFYDIIDCSNNRYAFITADVVGKSFPAAYLMILSITAIRLFSKNFLNPEDFILKLNDFIKNNTPSGKWITMSLIYIDFNTMDTSVFNCGNPDILVLKEGSVLSIPSNLPMIGQLDNSKLKKYFIKLQHSQSNHFILNPDTLIFTYTDGLSECRDKDNFMPEPSSFLSCIDFANVNSEKLKKSVIEKIAEYKIIDDVTFFIIKPKITPSG